MDDPREDDLRREMRSAVLWAFIVMATATLMAALGFMAVGAINEAPADVWWGKK